MTDLRGVTAEKTARLPDRPAPAAPRGDRPPGYRPTRQGRSADSERRLLEAAEALFRERGYTHTKVSDIIRLSGVSTGSFYHRFGDKAGLKDVLISRFVATTREAIAGLDTGRATHGDLRRMLRWLAGQIHDTMTANQGIYRIVDELSKTEPEKWESFRVLGHEIRDRVLESIGQYRDQIALPDDRARAAVTNVVQLMITVILQTRLGAAGMFPKERDQLLDMLVAASMGILQQGE